MCGQYCFFYFIKVTIANYDFVFKRNPIIKFKTIIKAALLCWPDSTEANISESAVKIANREVIKRHFYKGFFVIKPNLIAFHLHFPGVLKMIFNSTVCFIYWNFYWTHKMCTQILQLFNDLWCLVRYLKLGFRLMSLNLKERGCLPL